MNRLKLNIDENGRGVIAVDGVKLEGVTGFKIVGKEGTLTKCTIDVSVGGVDMDCACECNENETENDE